MRTTTTTIEPNINVDRPVGTLGTGAGATGVLAVSEDGPADAVGTAAVGTAASAIGVLTGSAGFAAAAGIAAGFSGRADGRAL